MIHKGTKKSKIVLAVTAVQNFGVCLEISGCMFVIVSLCPEVTPPPPPPSLAPNSHLNGRSHRKSQCGRAQKRNRGGGLHSRWDLGVI